MKVEDQKLHKFSPLSEVPKLYSNVAMYGVSDCIIFVFSVISFVFAHSVYSDQTIVQLLLFIKDNWKLRKTTFKGNFVYAKISLQCHVQVSIILSASHQLSKKLLSIGNFTFSLLKLS